MNIKSSLILVITSALLTNCASFKKNSSTADKVKPTLVSDQQKPEDKPTTTPVITSSQSSSPNYLPSIPTRTDNSYDDEAQVKNTTGAYPDLINADDPATEEQIYQEVSPVIKAPTNVITP